MPEADNLWGRIVMRCSPRSLLALETASKMYVILKIAFSHDRTKLERNLSVEHKMCQMNKKIFVKRLATCVGSIEKFWKKCKVIIKCFILAWLYAWSASHTCDQPLWTGNQIRSYKVCQARNMLQGLHLQGKVSMFHHCTMTPSWHRTCPGRTSPSTWRTAPSSSSAPCPWGVGWCSSPATWATAGPPPLPPPTSCWRRTTPPPRRCSTWGTPGRSSPTLASCSSWQTWTMASGRTDTGNIITNWRKLNTEFK